MDLLPYVLLLDCSDLIIANCGDCRAILSQAGQTIVLTRDHKPTDEVEHQRIVNHGGTVFGGRLQGKLAVSRAFGNYEFKELQILTSEPEIQHITLSPDVEYLVVGTDGLYEHFTNEEIISFIKNGLMNNSNLERVVKDLVEEAIDRGSEDNITILVVKFEKGFKKLLKKKAKKHTGKSPATLLPTVKNNNTTKSVKVSVINSFPEPGKTGLFKKGGLKLNFPSKNTSHSTAVPSSDSTTLTSLKKKIDPKKITPKTGGYKQRTSRPQKPNLFTYDFFGTRTPVIISG